MISNIQKLVLIFLSIVVFPVYSIEMPTFNGYLGYRYVWSSIKTETMPINSKPEIGLIGSWEPTDNWGFYGQLAYEEEHSFENFIVYGFVEYSNSLFDVPFRIQTGKIQDSLGLYNASRINPRTRPGGTIEPQAVYFPSLNLLLTSGLGVRTAVDLGDFTFEYAITIPSIDEHEYRNFAFFIPNATTSNVEFGDKKVLSIRYAPKNSKWESRLTYHSLNLSNEIRNLQWITLGTSYNESNWDIALEGRLIQLLGAHWSDGFSNLGYSSVLYGSYDISNSLSVRSMFSFYQGPKNVLTTAQQFIGFDDSLMYHYDLGLGLTYNIDNWDFMIDIHKIYGANWIDPPQWLSESDFKDWWYFGTSLTYHF